MTGARPERIAEKILRLRGNRTLTEGITLTRKESTNPGKKPCRKKSMQLQGSGVRYPTKAATGHRHDPLELPNPPPRRRPRQKRNNVISFHLLNLNKKHAKHIC